MTIHETLPTRLPFDKKLDSILPKQIGLTNRQLKYGHESGGMHMILNLPYAPLILRQLPKIMQKT